MRTATEPRRGTVRRATGARADVERVAAIKRGAANAGDVLELIGTASTITDLNSEASIESRRHDMALAKPFLPSALIRRKVVKSDASDVGAASLRVESRLLRHVDSNSRTAGRARGDVLSRNCSPARITNSVDIRSHDLNACVVQDI